MYPAQAQAMAGRMLAFDRTDTLRLLNMTAAFDADAGMEGVCETVYGMQWALVTVFAGCLTLFGVACYVFYLRTKYDLMESLADLKRVTSQRARNIPRPPGIIRDHLYCRLELIDYFDVDGDGLEASELGNNAGIQKVMAAELK